MPSHYNWSHKNSDVIVSESGSADAVTIQPGARLPI
jgi:hypothetical protein